MTRAISSLKQITPLWILVGVLVSLILISSPASAASLYPGGGPSGTTHTQLDVPDQLGYPSAPAQQVSQSVTNVVAFQDFGWDPDTSGASGSVTYSGVGSSFTAEVAVKDLKPSNTYNLYLMDVGLTGATSLDTTTYSFTTDAQGAATVSVAETFDVADGAPLPAFQVHFLVVDESIELSEPLSNPFGIARPIALACSFPLGFLQLDVPTAPTVSLSGDSVPLFNFGWAPGFEGGSGSVAYTGQNEQFEGTVTVQDLKADFTYTVRVMGSALNGDITAVDMELTTDSTGAGSIDITHAFPVPDGVPLGGFQVHFLVIDPSESLSAPLPNPLGVENPIVLACLFPLGFLQTGPGPSTAPAVEPVAELPVTGDPYVGALSNLALGLGAALLLGGGALVVISRRRIVS